MSNSRTEILEVAYEAVDDSPEYITHIRKQYDKVRRALAESHKSKLGQVFGQGLAARALVDATSDLEQFAQLVERVEAVVGAEAVKTSGLEAWKGSMLTVVQTMERCLNAAQWQELILVIRDDLARTLDGWLMIQPVLLAAVNDLKEANNAR